MIELELRSLLPLVLTTRRADTAHYCWRTARALSLCPARTRVTTASRTLDRVCVGGWAKSRRPTVIKSSSINTRALLRRLVGWESLVGDELVNTKSDDLTA